MYYFRIVTIVLSDTTQQLIHQPDKHVSNGTYSGYIIIIYSFRSRQNCDLSQMELGDTYIVLIFNQETKCMYTGAKPINDADATPLPTYR